MIDQLPKVHISRIDEYMKITEAADYVGVTTNTLRNWEKSGKITVRRHPFNKYRLYRKEDLNILLNTIEGLQ